MITDAPAVLLVEDNSDDEELTLRGSRRTNLKNPVDVVRDGQEASTTYSGTMTKPRSPYQLWRCSTSGCRESTVSTSSSRIRDGGAHPAGARRDPDQLKRRPRPHQRLRPRGGRRCEALHNRQQSSDAPAVRPSAPPRSSRHALALEAGQPLPSAADLR